MNVSSVLYDDAITFIIVTIAYVLSRKKMILLSLLGNHQVESKLPDCINVE